MCGRYSIFQIANTGEIEERFGATLPEEIEPRYDAAPGQQLPVITNDDTDAVSQLQWGLVPHWADDPEIGNRLINARAETVDEKNPVSATPIETAGAWCLRMVSTSRLKPGTASNPIESWRTTNRSM
jgi:hypothetical protein